MTDHQFDALLALVRDGGFWVLLGLAALALLFWLQPIIVAMVAKKKGGA